MKNCINIGEPIPESTPFTHEVNGKVYCFPDEEGLNIFKGYLRLLDDLSQPDGSVVSMATFADEPQEEWYRDTPYL